MNYKLMVILVLAFLTAVFIFQNTAQIDVSFLFWSVRVSQVLLMAIIFGVGALVGVLLSGFFRFRRRDGKQRVETATTQVSGPANSDAAVAGEKHPATEESTDKDNF